MGNREQLVQRWQEGLDRYEDEMRRASPHRRWLKRIYIRVYRFLLSIYGGGAWTADTDATAVADKGAATDEHGTPRGQLIDLRADEEGRPPKGVAEIRHTLKTVHGVAGSPELGPKTHGLEPDDWIVVASQRDGVDAQLFALALRRRGFPCRLSGWRSNAVVEVRYVHQEDALAVLEDLGSGVRLQPCDHPRPPWPPPRRVMLGACFGAVLGGICPLVVVFFLYGAEPPPRDTVGQIVMACVSSALLSAAIGVWLVWLSGGRNE